MTLYPCMIKRDLKLNKYFILKKIYPIYWITLKNLHKRFLLYLPMELPPFVRLPEKMVYREPSEPGIYIAQPFGKQCYVWFTSEGSFMVDIHKKKKWPVSISFEPELINTVVLGTLVYHHNHKCILVYDMFYYKGQKVDAPFRTKWSLLQEMLYLYISPSVYTLMMPLMSETPTKFHCEYPLYSTKIVTSTMVYHWMNPIKQNIYMIKPTSKSDIYMVHNRDEISYACIDTLQRSEMMNALFHSTPEYKEYTMECEWNDKFKKWTPLRVQN